MKKVISLFLILVFATTCFTGCASDNASIKVKIVIDIGADGIYETILFDSTVEVNEAKPSLHSLLDKMNQNGDITVKYTTATDGTLSLASIGEYINENDTTTIPLTVRQWSASINDAPVSGLWSDAICKTDDTILICYETWELTI